VAANAKRAVVPAPKPMPVVAYQSGGIQLPKTATDAELRMIFGLLMLALSLILLIVRRLRPQPVK
jgi:Ca-activated chloride channel family protein